MGSYSPLPKQDVTVARYTHTLEWMGGRTKERHRSGRSLVRYSLRRDTDHAKVGVHAENRCWKTNVHETQKDIRRND